MSEISYYQIRSNSNEFGVLFMSLEFLSNGIDENKVWIICEDWGPCSS